MRDILFRGFVEDNKNGDTAICVSGEKISGFWTKGFYVEDIAERAYIVKYVTFRDGEPFPIMLEVIPETVCEYIGLEDKNGKQIFEGDRILAHEEDGDREYSIRYKADQDYPAFDCDPYIDCDSNGLSYLFGVGIDVEAIGTIFDVKEDAR